MGTAAALDHFLVGPRFGSVVRYDLNVLGKQCARLWERSIGQHDDGLGGYHRRSPYFKAMRIRAPSASTTVTHTKMQIKMAETWAYSSTTQRGNQLEADTAGTNGAQHG